MPFPILPAILGGSALAGGAASLFGKSKPSRIKQIPQYSPMQTGIMNQLAQQGLANVDLGPIEQRAREQFHSQTLPSIAERFTSMGAGGQRSGAFLNALNQAGSDLESQLAALRPELGLQQLQFGLRPQFESIYMPSMPGRLQQLGAGLMGGSLGALGPAIGAWQQESALNTLGKMQQSPMQNQQLINLLQQILSRLGGVQ